ncbi:MAG: poly(A) polymerase [Solirubrobacteraceae bacterium]|nr:poly(A) polymerase [Solirubrobacteraceae bacterium]
MTGPLDAARGALAGERAWVVGGAVRDRMLGRATPDVDVVIEGEPGAAARSLAAAAGGVAFELSEDWNTWRVIGPDRAWQVDLSPVRAGTLETDLAERDFTVNAMAEPLAGGELIDPHGGAADLEARRLRMLSPAALAADPLRVMRLARLAGELELEADAPTLAAAREHAPRLREVAPERVFAELRRILALPDPVAGLSLTDAAGALAVVLPELMELRGLEQSGHHHLDAYGHTLAVLEQAVRLERSPADAFGEHADAVGALLAEPLADELTRSHALRLGALLHDVAKPLTRGEGPGGRVTFLGHDRAGADLVSAILRRLRASERLVTHVAALARHHLRLGFLVHERPLSRRAVHAYVRGCEPVEVDVTVLSVADRLATRGRGADAAIAAHLELARELLGAALEWRAAGAPTPLVRGDELAQALGIHPGPEIGRLLAELEAAQYAREIRTRDEALTLARATAARPAAG